MTDLPWISPNQTCFKSWTNTWSRWFVRMCTSGPSPRWYTVSASGSRAGVPRHSPDLPSWLQEYTIKQQLDCGVRYCDLRIAHRPNDSSTDLYFYHGLYTTLTVEVKTHTYTHTQIQTRRKAMNVLITLYGKTFTIVLGIDDAPCFRLWVDFEVFSAV